MLEGQTIQQHIGFPPMPAVAAILSRYDRQQLEAFVTVAIDLLDVADGDPDAEVEDPAGETVPVIDDPDVPPEEDERDPDLEETDCEDSFVLSSSALHWADGAGCSISDPGGCEHDGREVTGAEDDCMVHQYAGPGCPISDPGGCAYD